MSEEKQTPQLSPPPSPRPAEPLVPSAVTQAVPPLEEKCRRLEETVRLLNDQLQQAVRMQLLGQMTCGIAHDFNNLLSVINGYSELLLYQLGPGDPGRDCAEGIRTASERAGALILQLMACSRKQTTDAGVFSLNDVITDLQWMLRFCLGESITLVAALAPGLRPVRGQVPQMEQVVMNLAINARDAMPRGGELVIETSRADVPAGEGRADPPLRPGPTHHQPPIFFLGR
jgi:two-component system cell cycle sensor histidine kinase/response regulator CckA